MTSIIARTSSAFAILVASLSLAPTALADATLKGPANGATDGGARATLMSWEVTEPSCPSQLSLARRSEDLFWPEPRSVRTVDIGDLSTATTGATLLDLPRGLLYWAISTECEPDYLTGGSAVWTIRIPSKLHFDRRGKLAALRAIRSSKATTVYVRSIANARLSVVVATSIVRGEQVIARRRALVELMPGTPRTTGFTVAARAQRGDRIVATIRTRGGTLHRRMERRVR